MKSVRLFTIVALVLAALAIAPSAQAPKSPQAMLQAAETLATIQGDFRGALALYEAAFAGAGSDRTTAARALFGAALCHHRLGDAEAARRAFQRMITDFPKEKILVTAARERMRALGLDAARAGSTGQAGDALVERQGVWSGDAVNLDGRPSRDGRYLTFIDRSLKQANVALRDLRTGENRLLTRNTGSGSCQAIVPVMSPDGRRVAYGCTTDGDVSIRLTNVDASGTTTVTTLPIDLVEGLAWSPNAAQLAAILLHKDRTRQMALISVAGGGVMALRSLPANEPSLGGFSPDGRWLVYSADSESDNAQDIHAIAVDGSQLHTLVAGPGRDGNPMWTPDGRHVVFVSDRSGSNGLWAIPVADGRPVGSPAEIRPDIGTIDSLGFSRDGALFYGRYHAQRDIFIASIDPVTLRVTSTPRRLSDRSAGVASSPHWSPDGRSIAFLAGADIRNQMLVIRSVVDGVERTLPVNHNRYNFTSAYGFDWYPDSRAVLIRDEAPERGERVVIRRVEVETGRAEVLFEAGQWDVWPPLRLSRDGKTLFYTAFARDTTRNINQIRLMKRDLTTGQQTELFARESGYFAFYGLLVSPDGSRLVFLDNVGTRPRTLVTLPVTGGTATELFPTGGSTPLPTRNVQHWMRAWTPDGRYVISRVDDGSVWAFPTGDGNPRKLDWPLPEVGELSPDGTQTVYRVNSRSRELRTIPNLLSRLNAAR